ncbi:NfeD family protein [Microbacterium terricola]|uniref:Membrane protein n=1 Tax=Microbacterium terricola TaxID=344163 RepID=A0ABM8DYD6_9MICO|nr:NfeD family protein [Microbacterium terricola]UYK38778.1 NfeD family protein [Microbacterium terricola]BDV30530.1 membrane protein [Microbacterium terricola]
MEFIQTIEDFAWIGWLVLILVFLVIEMLTLDFTFLMLSIGGLAGLGSDLLGAPLWVQVIIAALVAAVLVVFLRPPLLRRLRRGEDPTPSNVDALRGLSGRILATTSDISGQVKLSNGDTWTARLEGDGELAPGTPVRVSRIDGATAFVRPLPEEQIP